MLTLTYVAAGGLFGTIARFAIQGWVQTQAKGTTFPIGTLIINVLGSLALGFIVRFATGTTAISADVRASLTVGFCGAFTTMSTFSYETIALLRDGDYLRAGLYMAGTILGCLAAIIAGTALANRLL